MRHVGRIVPAVVFVIGVFVAIRQLAVQNTAASEVMLTGAYVFGGIAALFLVLIGFGRGLGALLHRGKPADDDEQS